MAECDRPGKHRNPKHRKRAARVKVKERRLAKNRERQAALRLEREITTTVHCSNLRIGDEVAGRKVIWLAKGSRIIDIKFDDGTRAGFVRDDLGATLEVSNR